MQPASLPNVGGSLVFASRADLTLRRSGSISRQRGWYGRPAERCGLRSVVSEVSGVGSLTLLLLRHATPRDTDVALSLTPPTSLLSGLAPELSETPRARACVRRRRRRHCTRKWSSGSVHAALCCTRYSGRSQERVPAGSRSRCQNAPSLYGHSPFALRRTSRIVKTRR